MNKATLILLALMASCGAPEHRPRFPGVRPHLILLDPDARIGGPLRVRLDLVNDSDIAVLYDAQGCSSNGSIGLLGPDGKGVPFIDGPRSSSGRYSELAPRSSVTLLPEHDLTSEYLVSKPGRHEILFRGYIRIVDAVRYAQAEKDGKERPYDWLEGSVEDPSNAVTVDVRPGPLPERFVVAEKLLAALPPDWTFAINWIPPRTADPEYSLFPPGSRKGRGRIVLRLSEGPALKAETAAGEARGKKIYVTSSDESEKAWPGHRGRLAEILATP